MSIYSYWLSCYHSINMALNLKSVKKICVKINQYQNCLFISVEFKGEKTPDKL